MTGLLSTVRAQPTAVDTLRRALATGRVHHAYLFDGPDGVGKERTAFGLAQALVCERRAAGTPDACGVCHACVRAIPKGGEGRPLHPDVIVLERGLYDPVTIGRRSPETQDLSIDQVRTLVLARAAFAPTEGRAKVFIVRRAEELSSSAANALLKTLEEPGAQTHFILLSSRADSLLPTIRSRVQRVRFGALPDDLVIELLAGITSDGPAPSADEVRTIARLAAGSMATAVVLADPDASVQRAEFVARAMAAIESRDLGASLELAEESKKVGKDVLVERLEALAAALGAQAHDAVAGRTSGARRVDLAAARHALTIATLAQLDGNASAQLSVEAMFIRMRRV